MGIFDKFKDVVGLEDEDDKDITEEEIRAASSQLERKTVDPRAASTSKKDNNITPIRTSAVTDRTGAFKLVVIEPKGFDECPKLVDNLKSRKPVIINLEKIETDTARKIFDFLSGATYALNGNVQKVANNIFIFAPENVDISASTQKPIDFSGNPKNQWR